ncbi:MAG: DUF481 domain-containing protein [Planctomycetes bacterium]|nr:DUF481 domain-containing protein [Planctomycetota bacterium]
MKKYLLPLSVPMALAIGVSAAEDSEWSHSLSLGLNFSRGNTESTQFNTDYDGVRETEHSKLALDASIYFGEENDEKTSDAYSFGAQYNRTISERAYWLVDISYDVDNIADLDYRLQVGPGLGYSVIQSEKANLDLEAGLGYQSQQYNNLESTDAMAWNAAEKWSYQLNESAKVWQGLELSGDVSEGDDYLLGAEIGVETKIAGSFNLKAVLEDQYSNIPAPGKKKNDIRLTTTLVYNF